MDGWMDGWTDGWMDGRVDGRTRGRTTGQSEKKCGRIDGPLNYDDVLIYSALANLIVDEFLGFERKHGHAICILQSEMSIGSEDLTKIANT